jgi:hypothetical protein
MHIEQHDPAGVNPADLEEELGYEQMHGYGEGEDDGEGEYGDEVDEEGLDLENGYGQDDDAGVMMYQQQQQDLSQGNANM